MISRLFQVFSKHKVLLVSLFALSLFATVVHASGGPFTPHQTLDPDCVPNAVSCYVTSPAGGGGSLTSSQIGYGSSLGVLIGDSTHTIDPTTGDTVLAGTLTNGKTVTFSQNSNLGNVGIQGQATTYGTLLSGNYIAQIIGDFTSASGDAYSFGTVSTVGTKNTNIVSNGTLGSLDLTVNDTGSSAGSRLYMDSAGNGTFYVEGTNNAQFAVTQNGNNHQYVHVDIADQPVIKLGDIGNFGKSTLFTVDDPNQIISAIVKKSGTQSLAMQITDSNSASVIAASDTSVGASGAVGYNAASLNGGPNASLGYRDFATGQSNGITANIFGINAQLNYGSSSTFDIKNSSNNVIFQADNTSNPKIKMGDITSSGNKTLLVVNDSASTIEVAATNGLSVAGSVTQTAAQGCNILADSIGQIVCAPSDINLKQNILDLNYGLDTVMKLHPVTYTFKDTKYGSGTQIGFIAQELEQYVPEVVTQGPQYKSVNYGLLTSVLAKAIQELNIKVQSLGGITTNDSSFASVVASWLGNAGNNITRIFTGEICLTDPGQDPECINRDQLRQLKQLLNSNQTSVQTPQIETPAN